MVVVKKSSNLMLVLLFTAFLCAPLALYAEDHHNHGGYNHNHGNYNSHGNSNWHHNNGSNNYYYNGYYNGHGYYYSPFLYPLAADYLIVSPQIHNSTSSAQTHTASKSDVTVMKAQVELVSEGYYSGAVDGINGSQTTAAITAFQHDKGLAETGKLDDATLKALNVTK